ncbi:DUF6214 family protein [Streptomyces sp. NPDC058773]|uniref:DUF6214 family protein n=1 Tax=Streptomyces sp. NPDC058773 TaxID=3346632 RepID=UPI00368D1BE9
MSESDFYTVNHRYEAQGAPLEWPTWELRAHGSAAPAPDPAAPDDPAGPGGPGCPLPRLDPLGPWCSARLTFADGARVDVLVTVSDDHITVEDVRADPPLTLGGLADLARWIDGPLDDAFRAATGRPRKPRPTPRQPGPADVVRERSGGWHDGLASEPEPQPESVCGVADDPVRGQRPASSPEPLRHARSGTGTESRGEAGAETGAAPGRSGVGAGAAAECARPPGGEVTEAERREMQETGETGEAGAGVVPTRSGSPTGMGAATGTTATEPTGMAAADVAGVADGESEAKPAPTGAGLGHPAGLPASPAPDSRAEQPCEQVPGEAPRKASGKASRQAPGRASKSAAKNAAKAAAKKAAKGAAGRSVPSSPSAPAPPSASATSSTPPGPPTTPDSPTPDSASTPPDGSAPSPASAPLPSTTPAARARSAVLARTRTGERRKVAADAYRQAQREGRDPVAAVMLATGRNRRRSLRLIAGARDDGLLTPRHNKR